MSVPSLPLVLLLLLPGFLFIFSSFLVSKIRKLSAFEYTAWSLVVGLILVVVIYPSYAQLVAPPPGRAWPGLLEILEKPALVPGPVWATLYGASLSLGVLWGIGDRTGFYEWVFRPLGIELRLHGDVWGSLFKEAGYVQVYLNDGSLLFGWPEYYSSDRSQPGPELYLTQVQMWDSEQSNYVEMEGVKGILTDASRINRIEFLELQRDTQNAEKTL